MALVNIRLRPSRKPHAAPNVILHLREGEDELLDELTAYAPLFASILIIFTVSDPDVT